MGGGGLRQWQTGGRLDPFGSTTSEAWARYWLSWGAGGGLKAAVCCSSLRAEGWNVMGFRETVWHVGGQPVM